MMPPKLARLGAVFLAEPRGNVSERATDLFILGRSVEDSQRRADAANKRCPAAPKPGGYLYYLRTRSRTAKKIDPYQVGTPLPQGGKVIYPKLPVSP